MRKHSNGATKKQAGLGRHAKNSRTGAKANQARQQPAKTNGRVGQLIRLARWFGQEVRATRGLAGKVKIHSSVLRFRIETYLWEASEQKRYWEAWKLANEGATEEFAEVLHHIPSVKNRG